MEYNKKSNVASGQIKKLPNPVITPGEEEEEKKVDQSMLVNTACSFVPQVPKLLISTNGTTIPQTLPIFRGLHICTQKFVDKFK